MKAQNLFSRLISLKKVEWRLIVYGSYCGANITNIKEWICETLILFHDDGEMKSQNLFSRLISLKVTVISQYWKLTLTVHKHY